MTKANMMRVIHSNQRRKVNDTETKRLEVSGNTGILVESWRYG